MTYIPYTGPEGLKALSVRNSGARVNLGAQAQADPSATAGDAGYIPTPAPEVAGSDVFELPTDTVFAIWALQLNHSTATWTVEVQLRDDGPTAGTYTITLGGTPYAYISPGGETDADILQELSDLINAGGTYTSVFEAAGVNDAPRARLLIDHTATPGTTFTQAVSGPSAGSILSWQDATTCDYEICLRLGEAGSGCWIKPASGTLTVNDGDRLAVGGFTAVHLRVTSADGRVRRRIAPAVAEQGG